MGQIHNRAGADYPGRRRKVRKEGRQYAREDIVRILDNHIAAQAKQWGEDYIYTKWAREAKERKLSDYDAGKTIEVEREEYHDCGMDYCDCFMSDGSVSTLNFGYSD